MKIKSNVAVKTLAIVISLITAATAVISIIGVFLIADKGFYIKSREEVRQQCLEEALYDEMFEITSNYHLSSDEYDIDNELKFKNYYITIKDDNNNILISNYNNEDVLISVETTIRASDIAHWPDPYLQSIKYSVTGYIPATYKTSDSISFLDSTVDVAYTWKYGIIAIGFISLLMSIFFIVYLMSAAGYRKGKDDPELCFFDKIPADLILVIYTVTAFIERYFLENIQSAFTRSALFIIIIAFDYLLVLLFFMSISVRIKKETLIRNNLTTHLLILLGKLIKRGFKAIVYIVRKIALIYKLILIMIAGFFAGLILIGLNVKFAVILFSLIWLALTVLISLYAINLSKLKEGGEMLSQGKLSFKVDTKMMFGGFKKHAECLNSISDGMSLAVEERLKSERFKTELITNVSHDLKTPLTSIVNYIDLLKKEKTNNDAVKNYLEILDRQSAKLKKLTEDLVEASKASTGNIEVHLTPCELCELLTQTTGEYQDKIQAQNLDLIISHPDTQVKILADGRHLWRIFDNLLNNICKYAQPGTRVYLNLEVSDKIVRIIFRNTSRYELNVSGDELTERFVRGDKARNTHGSGLGLSIAKSLTELQNGTLNIITDGDLFKVVLSFTELSE